MYIADQWSSQIRRIDATTGTITRYAGNGVGSTGDSGPATAAKFNSLACLALDSVGRKLYISDCFNYKVRVIDMVTGIITAFAGTGTSGYTGDGGPATAARFSRVMGLCRDKAGNLYIGDWDNARIRRVDIATGIVTTYAGNGTMGYSGDGGPALSASIAKPFSLCMDTCDNMYFSDEDNHVVRRIDAASGIITTVAGSGTAGYSGDGGPALAAQFNHPTGVIIDNAHNLYISDHFNHRVRKMTYVPPTPTVAVTIAPLPNDTVCAGTAVTYTATATGTAPPTYTWYRNGVVVSTAGSTYTYTPTHADSVRCVATVQVCGVGTAWASSNTIHMVVTPLVMPTISLGGSTAAPLGSTVTVTATVAGAGSSYNISWYRNGLPLATTTAPLVTYTKTAGTDAITARLSSTDPTGCYDTATAASHTVLVGPNEVGNITTQPMAVTVSPNPVRTVLRIDGDVHTWRIMGITGAVLLQGGPPAGHTI